MSKTEKVCKTCNESKADFSFYKNRDSLMVHCKKCVSKRNTEYNKKWSLKKPFNSKIKTHKHRALEKGIPFDLTATYLEELWTGVCPVSNQELRLFVKKNSPYAAELDKIVPEKGYVMGNVMWLSRRVNRIKSDASLEELEQIVKWLRDRNENED